MSKEIYKGIDLVGNNINISGCVGSGRTRIVKDLTLDLVKTGIETIIIDNSGEFEKYTKSIGGKYIKLSSKDFIDYINPSDIGEYSDFRTRTHDFYDERILSDIDFQSFPVVTFDLSELKETILPVSVYIIISCVWDEFMGKDIEKRKRIVYHEINQLQEKNNYIYDLFAKIIENQEFTNVKFTIVSQGTPDIQDSQDLLLDMKKFTGIDIFLKQCVTSSEYLEHIGLSVDDIRFLFTAQRGEMLIRINGESMKIQK